VAGVLRVWETTTESTVDAITRFVADRRVLLVLDNCEHVIEAAADVAFRLLAGCPSLTILATSREPLGVPGEVIWRVPTLAAPGTHLVGLVELSTFDAVRLFGDRARRAQPGFALTEANAAAVGEICRRLDGIPLALELAAARCRAMTPDQIAAELDHRFRVLTGGARTVMARQQTLLASIEWSHDLLDPDERALFRKLGVFTGPFPLDAAETIGGDTTNGGRGVFDVLSRLVDKSLLLHDPDTGWYRLLESIRLYAIDRCRDAGELEALREGHARWWASWLDAHHPDAPCDADLDAIHHAYPNLRAALLWAVTTDPELALELAGGLGLYWYLHGLLGDAVALGDFTLASAEHGPLWARAVGRMARPRHYASDTYYMTTVVDEACAIAEATGDDLTPVRCQSTHSLTIEDVEEFRELARRAESCGDLWDAARMQFCVAQWDLVLDTPEAPIELKHLADRANTLDAGALRFTVHHIAAERLAAQLQVREAIARLSEAMRLADRASPTTAIAAFSNLAWYGRLCGEPAPLEQVISLLTDTRRDWGRLAPLASLLAHLPELLAGSIRWDGADVALPSADARTLWMFADAIGEDRVTLFPAAANPTAGQIARFGALVMSARVAFREGRLRQAETAVTSLVRSRSVDRHFWLLMLARCATDAGSHQEAARLLGAVVATQERFRLPWLPCMLLKARAETEELGRDALGDQAFDAARAEGAELDLDAAVTYVLRARGERKRPSTGWDSLTPTELEVVAQVAAGRTNPDIADVLLMGRTTVKTHLAHIFTKLGLSNRAELAAAAARRASSTPG
jgi:predicted ATPase/DNA-binding CsgD family transcriptional regulator